MDKSGWFHIMITVSVHVTSITVKTSNIYLSVPYKGQHKISQIATCWVDNQY